MNLEIFYQLVAFASILVITWILAKLVSALLGRLLKRSVPLVATKVRRIAWVLVWLLGLIFAVEQLGLRVDLLLLLLALLGASALIAHKDALQNIASRYFSDVYIPIKVGDSIKIREYSGKVIEINPLSTILLTEQEELVSIPNALFIREIVANISPQAWKEVSIPIVIDGAIDIAWFEREVLKFCNKLRIHLDERFPPILSVKNKSESSTELLLTLMIKEPTKKDVLISEVNSKVAEIIEKAKERKE